MAQFKAFDPNVEVNGQTVLSIVAGMGAFKTAALQILEKNGIKDPQPNKWYKQQAWLDSFKEIAERIGASTLYNIGMKIPDNADFPPEIDNIEKALSAIDVAYHMNHRGGDIGYYKYIKTGEKEAKVECKNPYPSDFDRGIVEAMAKRFRPPGSIVYVKTDPNAPTRLKGAESCTYIVTW
jgi:hypothetical protein